MSLRQMSYTRAVELRDQCAHDLALARHWDHGPWIVTLVNRLLSLDRLIARSSKHQGTAAGQEQGQ